MRITPQLAITLLSGTRLRWLILGYCRPRLILLTASGKLMAHGKASLPVLFEDRSDQRTPDSLFQDCSEVAHLMYNSCVIPLVLMNQQLQLLYRLRIILKALVSNNNRRIESPL